MKKKILATLIAAMAVISPLTLSSYITAPATAFAEDTGAVDELPDWVPTDFETAVDFCNTYGATHIENGYVCVVYKMDYEKYDPEMMVQFLRYQLRRQGDALRMEYSDGYTYSQEPVSGDTLYFVMLFSADSKGSYECDMIDNALENSPDTEHPKSLGHYSFKVDSTGNITETDIYSWLPDSMTEYREYVKNNGEVSVKDNNVVFCTTATEQFGDKWEPDANNKYECFKYLLTSDCTMEEWKRDDDCSIDRIYVCQAVEDGYEKLSWVRTSDVRPDPDEPNSYTLTADCVVTDKAWSVLLADTARFRIYDSQWKLADISEDDKIFLNPDILYSSGEEGVYACVDLVSLQMTENPFYWDISQYKDADIFEVSLLYNNIPEGYFLDNASTEVRKFDNGAIDYIFKLKKSVSGDTNGDGKLNIADLVVFKRWLLGTPDAELANWKAADLCSDGKLDVFDLCLMRRLLVENNPKLKNTPVIIDDYGKVSDEQRIALTETLSKKYPDVDMSDFTFVYSPDHPLSNHFAGPCFYVYYKGILAHGYGDLGEYDNVFAAFDYKGNPTIELLIAPEKYKEIDLAPENMLSENAAVEEWMRSTHDICKIIYFDHDDSSQMPNRYSQKIAYLLKSKNHDSEIVIDAVTGEEIEYIPYYVPVVD
jgi:hypothetical protein